MCFKNFFDKVRLFLKQKRYSISSSVSISPKAQFNRKTKFIGNNSIGNSIVKYSELGEGSYIGDNCVFFKTKIGKYCSISSDVKVLVGNHPTEKYVSTHPAFFSSRFKTNQRFNIDESFNEFTYTDDTEKYLVEIGNDVWIANGVSILSGVKIGDGAIIAAGAVVAKDVPDYAIVGGVPSKLIKYRFDKETVDFLIDLSWWDKPVDWLHRHAQYFSDIEELKKDVNK